MTTFLDSTMESTFVVPSVMRRHASEVCYLATSRDGLLNRIDKGFRDLHRHDRKLEQHLYALALDRSTAEEALERELRLASPGLYFVRLSLALKWQDEDLAYSLIGECTGGDEPRGAAKRRVVSRALGAQLACPWVRSMLASMWKDARPARRQIAFDAIRFGAGNLGGMLAEASSSTDTYLRARALQILGEDGALKMLPMLRSIVANEAGDTRFAAAWSCAFLGDSAPAVLAELCQPKSLAGRNGWDAVCSLMIGLHPSVSAVLIQDLVKEEECWPIAAVAMGLTGDVRFVPWILDKSEQSRLARPCLMALTLILGIDPATHGNPIRKREQTGCDWLNQKLDNWPMPDTFELRQFWRARGAAFQPGCRYLLGTVATSARAAALLFAGPLFFRPIGALVASSVARPTPLFPTWAPSHAQARLLSFDPLV